MKATIGQIRRIIREKLEAGRQDFAGALDAVMDNVTGSLRSLTS
jgi:hypothetical protein